MLKGLLKRFKKARAPRGPKYALPWVERLGERILPAIMLHWDGGAADSFMSSPMNYLEGVTPTPGDTVLFDGANGPAPNKDAIADAGLGAIGFTMQGITLSPVYQGQLSIQCNLTVVDLNQFEPTITVAAGNTLTTRHFAAGGGTLSGAGGLNVLTVGPDPGFMNVSAPTTVSIASCLIATGSSLSIAAPTTLDGSTLTNNGTTTWAAGQITLFNSPSIQNNNQFLVLPSDKRMAGSGSFVNAGAFTADLAPGNDLLLECNFTQLVAPPQAAPFEAKSGAVTLSLGTNSFAAPILIDAGATLDVGTSALCNAGTTFTGGGQLVVSGRLLVPANQALQINCALSLTGSIEGQGAAVSTLTTNAGLTWTRGGFRNIGVTVMAGASLSTGGLGPPPPKTLTNAVLILSSATVWDGGNIDLTDSTISNRALFEVKVDTVTMKDTDGNSQFRNENGPTRGQLSKTAGAGSTMFDIPIWTAGDILFNGRTMQFAKGLTQDVGGWVDLAGGTMDLTNSDMITPQTYLLSGGTLRGGGTVTGVLVNSAGVVQVGGDTWNTLAINSDYRQGADATLRVSAADANSWGLLRVAGKATIAGSLQVQLLGGYAPAMGLQRSVVAARSGLVGGFNVPGPTGWDVLYPGGGVILVRSQKNVVVATSQNDSVLGQAVTFTATVSGSMVGSPTGTVSFYDGATLLGTVTLTPGMMGATASFTTSALALGDHQITAVYSGDSTFLASTSSPVDQMVQQEATMTWASSSQGYSAPGQAVTFTATVSGGMVGSPTGTISFYDGTTLLGTVSLVPGMMGTTASFTTSSLALGNHQITAVYSGDSTFDSSTSWPLTQTVWG